MSPAATIANETNQEPASAGPLAGQPAAQDQGGDAFRALEGKAVHATVWTVISYGVAQVLRFVNSMVLARLLLPDSLGEMTLVSTLIIGMTMLSDIGLEPSVIQSKRGDEPVFLNTAWSLQALRGGALWLIAAALSWPAANFYHDPRLLYVLPVLAAGTVIGGLYSTNLLSLSRHMGVRRLFFLDLSAQFVTLIVAIVWALRSPSVWALVAGNLAGNAFRLAISHWPRLVPGIRNRFRWDPACVKEIIHFGKWIFLGTAFWFFATQSDRLILGKLVPLGVLGVYGIAYSLSDMPRAIINAFSTRVGYPFIAKIIHLPMPEFRARYLRYRLYALLAGGSMLSLMIVWGGWTMLHLYPARYAAGGWIVPILAAGLWHTLLYQTTAPTLYALGKAKYAAFGNGCYCATIVLAVPTAFHFFHLPGAVVAVAAGDFPLYLVLLFGATREGVRPLRQDLLLTLGFLCLLAVEFTLKHALR
jgi:O-antigen/teichoic acid export membrane protein